jgi:RecB family exonuclease
VGVPFPYRERQWSFSVSQLTDLGQCPFKWFARQLLALGAPAEAEAELSPSLKGQLYHKTAELVVAAVREDPARSPADPELLRSQFLAAERAIGLPALPAWAQRREEHLQQLGRILAEPSFWPQEAHPVALEQSFSGQWQGLPVTGRVDRIDRGPQGLVLIDYKTGSTQPAGVQDSGGRAQLDLQLPLYQEVAAPQLFPQEAVGDAY